MSTYHHLAMIERAEQAMGINADAKVLEPDLGSRHTHIAISWRGGVLWLDMSEQSDHFCIDVRQFADKEEDGSGLEVAASGVFGMVEGRRNVLCPEVKDEAVTYNVPLAGADGHDVRGHSWNGSYMVTLMRDKEPSEDQTFRPEPKL